MNLGQDPDIEEIVEITKWGHKVSTEISQGQSGSQVESDRSNLEKSCSGQVLPAHVSLLCGRGRRAQDGHHRQEEHATGQEGGDVVHYPVNTG